MSNAKKLENDSDSFESLYKELSFEINNEIINRIIEDNKIIVSNIRDNKIRENNEKKFDEKISKNKKDIETLFDEIKKIKKEINTFSISEQIQENTPLTEKKQEKEQKLKESEEKLVDKMNNLNKMLNERKESSSTSKEDIENKIKETTTEIESVKEEIFVQSEEIKIIQNAEDSFLLAKNLELLKEEVTRFNNLYNVSEIIFKEYTDNHKNTNKLIKSIKSIAENVEQIIDEKSRKKFNSIVSSFRSKSYNFDVEYMFSNKISTDNEKLYIEVNKKDFTQIKNKEEFKKLENYIKDSFNKISQNNSKIKMKTKELETIYFEFKSICHSLETLFKELTELLPSVPVIDRPKVDVPKVDVPKVDVPKVDVPKVDVPKVEEPKNNEKILPILIRKVSSKQTNNFSLPTSLFNQKNYLPNDKELETIFKNELPRLDLDVRFNIKNLQVQDSRKDGTTISEETISRIISGDFLLDNLRIVGPGMRAAIAVGKTIDDTYKNFTFSGVEKTSKMVKIFDEKSAIRLATMMNKLPDDRSKKTNYQVKKCYYSSLENEFIVPAYEVIASRNGANLLNTIIPASTDLFPVLKVKSLEIKGEEVITKKVRFLDNEDKDIRGSKVLEKDEEKVKFIVKVNKESLNPDDEMRIVSTFEIDDNYSKDETFTLYLPKKLSKDFAGRLDKFWVSIITMNKFGFSNQIRVTLDLSPYRKYFEFLDVFREENTNHGGSRHNYGIEWAECCIGGTIYDRFIEEMDSIGVHKEYSLDPDQSLEKHFKDYDNVSAALGTRGSDDHYIDNVDISAYIGHGSGDGFTFETSIDDGKLTDMDARGGKAWGNRDLEFQALMSCQVLREMHGGRTWAERWGPSFNGMHLLLGFQTNAWVADHNMLRFFARNMYKNKQTVMISWLNAALNDQPDDTQAVVMGPLVSNSNRDAYNSVNSTIPNLYRAHWNDYTWGIKNGPGVDVPRTNVNGWWRIIMTV